MTPENLTEIYHQRGNFEVRMTEKGGVEFKGGSLHDGFGGFDGSGEHLAPLSLVLENTGQKRGNRDGFGGFGGYGGFGRDGYPPLNSLRLTMCLRCTSRLIRILSQCGKR